MATEKKLKVYIKEPCMHEGKHYGIGDDLDLTEEDALSIIGAGRGTFEKVEKPKPKPEEKK